MSDAAPSAFTLFIESGRHAGSVQRLAEGLYTLGSELDADIVLTEDRIEPVHLIFELGRTGLRLEPLQAAVAVGGEQAPLEPGGERRLTLPATFAIGDVSIRITAPTDAIRTRRRQRALVAAAGSLAILALGMPLVGGWNTEAAVDDEIVTTASAATAERHRPSHDPVETAAVKPLVTLDDAARALRERLAADGLSDIEVKTAVDRLVVHGEAEPGRMAAWRDIRIWFDRRFGQDVLVVATVEPAEAAEPPKLAIEAVWSGEDPYLIAGGRRLAAGAAIGDDWTIDRIRRDAVVFRRGDEVFSLTL